MAQSEVTSRAGKPVAMGELASGETYWDYTQQPRGYTIERVIFGADGRVRDVRNLLTEQNFASLKPGMAPAEVLAIIGPSAERERYANGTSAWNYRFYDYGVVKLGHVIFDSAGRVLWQYTEWDPSVYSKKGGGRGR
jgi:hypothetical protein